MNVGIAPHKVIFSKNILILSFYPIKAYFVGTQWKRFAEAFLISTNNDRKKKKKKKIYGKGVIQHVNNGRAD